MQIWQKGCEYSATWIFRGGGWFCFDDDLIFKLKTVVESVNV